MAEQSSQSGHSYILDPESAAEMARLLLQDRLLAEATGGLLPERPHDKLTNIWDILDVACGPGGWVTSMARKFPHVNVVGIDISDLMVTYAKTQVVGEGLTNAHFQVMNILEPFKFPDASFDMVNMRGAIGVVLRTAWPTLLAECVRILRPGGVIRLGEADQPAITNSAAFEETTRLIARMLHMLGYGFSPDGYSFGMTPMLGKLLADAGCHNIRFLPHVFDFSYGTPLYMSQMQNYVTAYSGMRASLLKLGLTTPEGWRRLHTAMLAEMEAETFRALTHGLNIWGEK